MEEKPFIMLYKHLAFSVYLTKFLTISFINCIVVFLNQAFLDIQADILSLRQNHVNFAS